MEELKRFDDDNLALEISKCEFFKTEAHWLGHKLSPSGTTQKKKKQRLKLNPPKCLNNFDHLWVALTIYPNSSQTQQV